MKIFGQDFAGFGRFLATKSDPNSVQNAVQIDIKKKKSTLASFLVKFYVFADVRNLKNRAPVEAGAQFLQNWILVFDAKRHRT